MMSLEIIQEGRTYVITVCVGNRCYGTLTRPMDTPICEVYVEALNLVTVGDWHPIR